MVGLVKIWFSLGTLNLYASMNGLKLRKEYHILSILWHNSRLLFMFIPVKGKMEISQSSWKRNPCLDSSTINKVVEFKH